MRFINWNINITKITLLASICLFILSSLILLSLQNLNPGLVLFFTPNNITYFPNSIFIDGISLGLILLTTFLTPIIIIASSLNKKENQLCLTFFILEIILLILFILGDIISFYAFFEAVLFPIYFVITTWGYRIEKLAAAWYFIFFTVFTSLIFLFSIISIFSITGTISISLLSFFEVQNSLGIFYWLGFFIAFAGKLPLIPLAIWLPLAHVESSLGGSILLAGVLLKLGIYGILRLNLSIFSIVSLGFTPTIWLLGILATIQSSLSTLRQTDLKRIVAYSSIAHIAIAFIGLFSSNILGLTSSYFLGLAHAFSSSGMFIIVTLLYFRYGSRSIRYFRGAAILNPLISLFFLLFTLANVGFPITANFIGEFFVFQSLFVVNNLGTFFGSISVLLCGFYSIFLINRVCFGIAIKSGAPKLDISRKEFFLCIPLVIVILILGLKPNFALILPESSLFI